MNAAQVAEGPAGLTGLSLPELTRLQAVIERGDVDCPLSELELLRCGLAPLWPRLAAIRSLGREGALVALQVAIAERKQHVATELDLVWTGPDLQQGVVRDTAAVVRQLLSSSEKTVVLGGCYFTQGRDILQPLHTAMRERGVRVTLCLDVGQTHRVSSDPLRNAQHCALTFLQDNWPFGKPLPTFYYDQRTAQPRSLVKLHAKCIVVDDRLALVTSANFTHLGQTENIEAGVLVKDPAFATKLAQQFRHLIDTERLLPCPLPDNHQTEALQAPEGWEDATDFLPDHPELIAALIEHGLPGPDDYGSELSVQGRVIDQTCLMHWDTDHGRVALVEDEAPEGVDGHLVHYHPSSNLPALAEQLAEALSRAPL